PRRGPQGACKGMLVELADPVIEVEEHGGMQDLDVAETESPPDALVHFLLEGCPLSLLQGRAAAYELLRRVERQDVHVAGPEIAEPLRRAATRHDDQPLRQAGDLESRPAEQRNPVEKLEPDLARERPGDHRPL